MNNIFNFGPYFKEIRIEKKVSLAKASEGITSKSSLSEWENKKGKMDFEKVVKMLERLYIAPSEFIIDSIQNSIDDKIIEIEEAYTADDFNELKNLYVYYSENKKKDVSAKNSFILELITANAYMALTGSNLLSQDKQDIIEMKLQSINNWYQEDVFLFGNSSFLLPVKLAEKLNLRLVDKIMQVAHVRKVNVRWTIVALEAVINSSFILLLRDNKKGEKVIKNLRKLLPILEDYGTQLVRFRFLECSVNYIKTKDSSEFENKFFPAIEFLSFSNYVEGLKYAYKQLKAVYG